VADTSTELDLRRVLHWLVDAVSPRPITEKTEHPAHVSDVRAAIDKGFHYTAPAEQLSAAESNRLNELLAKQERIAEAQREADRLAAEEAAEVENTGLPGS